MTVRYTFLLLMMMLLTQHLNACPQISTNDTLNQKTAPTSISADTISIDNPRATTYMDTINHKRLTPVIISGALLYAGSMSVLYQFWYKNHPQSKFHFLNDNKEWLQMDKMGHATTAYYLGKLSYNSLRWSGLAEKKSVLFGGAMGIFYLTAIEILDGFSAKWGFSSGDMIANTFGSGLFVSQQLLWKEQRLQLKWSYHQSKYAPYRPDLLGKNLSEEWVKDYNGQTYWLSANIKSFLSKEHKFPAWLNLAVGYGAEGMTGAAQNSLRYNGTTIPPFKRYRQFYLSGDIDISRIKTRSKTLHLILNALSFIKIPFPTLELSQGKIITHPLYF